MNYGVFCTFDLKNASSTDYQNAYSDLGKIGLKKIVAGGNGNVVIPTTSVFGEINGNSTASVRDNVRQRVANAFQSRGFTSEIFVYVGDDWTWGATTT